MMTTTNLIRRAATMLAVLAMMASTAVFAAPASLEGKIEVHVPFAFAAGKATLPAGDYIVRRERTNVLLIQNKESHEASLLITLPTDTQQTRRHTALVFNRYSNGNYFLAQVRSFDGTTTFRITPSSGEEQMARGETPTQVAVVALD